MKILLLGANGQVGRALQPVLGGMSDLIALGREDLDLRDAEALRKCIRQERPDVLVNAAAYTAVDRAESETALAFRINAEAVGDLARSLAETGGFLLHYSTDYVFDGDARRPYEEDDDTRPLNQYGASKLAGERAVRAADLPHLILRISWIYAQQGQNFLQTVLRLARERPELRIVDDQWGAPTWAEEVARASAHALGQVMSGRSGEKVSGTYHLSAAGMTSWHGYAQEILRLRHGGMVPAHPVVRAIATEEFPTPAVRPRYSVLNNEKFAQRFGLRLPAWQESLADCLERMP